MAGLVDEGKNLLLEGFSGSVAFVSLHTADPGTSASAEVSGGSYTREGVSWATPASDGGSRVTDYVVQYRVSSGNWTTWTDDISTETSAVITGLTNGAIYFFRVAAITAVGTGQFASEPIEVIPLQPAAKPTNLRAVEISGGVRLEWSAPENTGNQPVLDYRIEYQDGNLSNWIEFQDAVSNDLYRDVRILPSNVNFRFRVAAITSAGIGDYSSMTPFVRPGS